MGFCSIRRIASGKKIRFGKINVFKYVTRLVVKYFVSETEVLGILFSSLLILSSGFFLGIRFQLLLSFSSGSSFSPSTFSSHILNR